VSAQDFKMRRASESIIAVADIIYAKVCFTLQHVKFAIFYAQKCNFYMLSVAFMKNSSPKRSLWECQMYKATIFIGAYEFRTHNPLRHVRTKLIFMFESSSRDVYMGYVEIEGTCVKRVRKQERCKRYMARGNILRRLENRSAKCLRYVVNVYQWYNSVNHCRRNFTWYLNIEYYFVY